MTDWSPYSKLGGHTEIAKIGGPLNYGLAVTADNQAYTLTVPTPKHENGAFVSFKMPAAASAGVATLNVNSLGAKKMYCSNKISRQIGSGDLQASGVYLAQYDSTLDSAEGGWVVYGIRPTGAGWTGGSNAVTTRAFDCDNTTLDELADVVATLLSDLGV